MINISKNALIFIKYIFGSLFKESFYRDAINFRLSRILILYFVILFMAYMVPFTSVFSKFVSIDLVNPNNLISKKIDHVISQIPSFDIKDGKINNEDIGQITITEYQNHDDIIVFDTKELQSKTGALYFGSNGLYYNELVLSYFITNLFEIPSRNFISSNHDKVYEFLSYDNFEDISISSNYVRSLMIDILAKYDRKYILIVSLYFVIAKFFILLVQITIFTFLAIAVFGPNKQKYYKTFVLTTCAFIPYFILELVNIITYKQSFILNTYPSSFLIFLFVNFYFVRFAAKSIDKSDYEINS